MTKRRKTIDSSYKVSERWRVCHESSGFPWFIFFILFVHFSLFPILCCNLLTSVFQYSVDLLTSVLRQFSLFHTTFSWQQYVFRNFSLFHTTFSWQQYVSRNFSLFHTTFSWQQYVLTPNFFTFSNQMSFSY